VGNESSHKSETPSWVTHTCDNILHFMYEHQNFTNAHRIGKNSGNKLLRLLRDLLDKLRVNAPQFIAMIIWKCVMAVINLMLTNFLYIKKNLYITSSLNVCCLYLCLHFSSPSSVPTTRFSHHHLFSYPTNIGWTEQIIEVLLMKLSIIMFFLYWVVVPSESFATELRFVLCYCNDSGYAC
jgi:hypothetical protein